MDAWEGLHGAGGRVGLIGGGLLVGFRGWGREV